MCCILIDMAVLHFVMVEISANKLRSYVPLCLATFITNSLQTENSFLPRLSTAQPLLNETH